MMKNKKEIKGTEGSPKMFGVYIDLVKHIHLDDASEEAPQSQVTRSTLPEIIRRVIDRCHEVPSEGLHGMVSRMMAVCQIVT